MADHDLEILRRFNEDGHTKTDIENLLLFEMAYRDHMDLMRENTDMDILMDANSVRLFDETSSFEDEDDNSSYDLNITEMKDLF